MWRIFQDLLLQASTPLRNIGLHLTLCLFMLIHLLWFLVVRSGMPWLVQALWVTALPLAGLHLALGCRPRFRVYTALPTAARDRGQALIALHAFFVPVLGLGTTFLAHALGGLDSETLVLAAVVLSGWCGVAASLTTLSVTANQGRCWRRLERLAPAAVMVVAVSALLSSLAFELRPSPSLGTTWYALAFLSLGVSAAALVRAWRTAADVGQHAAPPKKRRLRKRYAFLQQDISVPSRWHGNQAWRWLAVATAGALVLWIAWLADRWEPPWQDWRPVHGGFPARPYCIVAYIALGIAFLNDWGRDRASIRALRALPVSAGQIYRHVAIGGGVPPTAIIVLPGALLVAPLFDMLSLAVVAGGLTAMVPWNFSIRSTAAEHDLEAFVGLAGFTGAAMLLLPLAIGEELRALTIVGTTLVAATGLVFGALGYGRLLRDRSTPRGLNTGRE